ncbi:MAG TPA: phosphotransferase, partial [Castellaniella sp.]|nr:phosphotransferase [Castellaniella sp.]
ILKDLVAQLSAARIALVHGDISPKNILLGPYGPVFLDAECAWYGDPAFDVAFCLNHLLLKCFVQPSRMQALSAAFEALCNAYLGGVSWEPAAQIDARAAALLPALLLARVDGQSPVEYITDDAEKNVLRKTARALLLSPVDSVAAVRDRWHAALGKFYGKFGD